MNSTEPETRSELPSFRAVLATSIILAVFGWVGLFILVILTVPTLGPRWLLFFLVTLAFSGMSLPVAHYLHRRFPSVPAAGATVLIRESLWVGLYVDTILWLQFGKVLNFALAVFIAFGLVAVELLIRLRERSRFTPQIKK